MRPLQLCMFLGLQSVAQASLLVTIDTEPGYLALPFCARNCLWNDEHHHDVTSNITFIYPCFNSCYCNPTTIENALAHLSECIPSSTCCDMVDYVNAVSLYYSYCNSHDPWSMPVPSQIGTAPPRPTTRTTSHSTAEWCSTTQFSPTPSSTTTSGVSTTGTTRGGTPTATTRAGDSDDDDDDITPRYAVILPILLPCIGGGITLVALAFFAWKIWKTKKLMKAKFGKRPVDSIPLITVDSATTPRRSMASSRPSLALSHQGPIEAGDLSDEESDLGVVEAKSIISPPPYAP